MITLILLVFAFVCFVILIFNIPFMWNLIAAGLAFWVLSVIFSSAHLLR